MPLLHFYGRECPHCIKMEPLIAKLEDEGVTLEKYETWHNADNAALFDKHDKGCGGVPYFVNTETGKTICGEASYEELKELAGK